MTTHSEPTESISQRILLIRGHRVMLDAALADLYGVTTRRLNEQVRRNRTRFPDDFLIEVTADELANLKSHFATSSWGGRRKLPVAFTELGAIMAATVLSALRRVILHRSRANALPRKHFGLDPTSRRRALIFREQRSK
jgi:hypothetical protein